MPNEDAGAIARRVAARIKTALDRNWYLELGVTIALFILFVAGIGILIAAFVVGDARLSITGAILEAAISYPIAKLLELRRENLRLQIVPDLIQFADTFGGEKSQELAFAFVVKLIERL